MRFTVVTFGTEGDTRPLVALCVGLQDAGHSVALFADRSTLDTAKAHGVSAFALSGDIKATVGPEGALGKLMKDGGGANGIAKATAEIAQTNTESWLKAAVDHAKESNSDAVLFSGVASYVGLASGECSNIPSIGLGLIPIFPDAGLSFSIP
jgi:UDP:flavonoid glycosyltransferase YjiC (YdhE family)